MASAERISRKHTSLLETLYAHIKAEGPISVADYMAFCLSDPAHGYYMKQDPLGARGDFITAPEISQIFGELIGLWCIAAWQQMGKPQSFRLIELGPGRGTLMADALRAAGQVSDFCDAASVHLVETSPALRAAQKEMLTPHADRLHWHDHLADVPKGPSIIVGNEFLDALPVRQFQFSCGEWFERCVGIGEDGTLEFCLAALPIDDDNIIPAAIRNKAQEEDFAEIRPAQEDIAKALAARASNAPLAALFIDYGHTASAPGETLQALSQHDYADPLAQPGNADLTAHVDFGALSDSASRAGLDVHGPLTQGAFLMSLGLQERCERLVRDADAETRADIVSGAQRLADPAQMGDLFKVMALSSHGLFLPPFEPSDSGYY